MNTSDPDELVEHLADLAEDDLDLVAQAIEANTEYFDGTSQVNIEATERWIQRAIDALAFDTLTGAVGTKPRRTYDRRRNG